MHTFQKQDYVHSNIICHHVALPVHICIVMLVTWHADPQTFFKKVYLFFRFSANTGPVGGYTFEYNPCSGFTDGDQCSQVSVGLLSDTIFNS